LTISSVSARRKISITNSHQRKVLLSNTFYFSQLAALAVFGAAAAINNVRANEFYSGTALISLIIIIAAIVLAFKLPARMANSQPLWLIRLTAILVSLVGVYFAYSNAGGYFELPNYGIIPAGFESLRLTALIGLGAFSVAFIVNLISVGVSFSKADQ
jgi:hypothetical protein